MGADRTAAPRPVRFVGSAASPRGCAPPTSRSARGPVSPVFVVLAIVALVSIALAPRGVLRAAVADDFDLPSRAGEALAIDTAVDAVDLPGLRAVVSREEQDPDEVLLDALTTTVLPGAPLPPSAWPSRTVDTSLLPPAPPAPTSANGDRAPPRPI